MGIAGNEKLIIEFGEPDQPELIELRIMQGREVKERLRRSGSTGIKFSWTKFPKAVSAYLLAYKIHSQVKPGKPFSLTATGNNNPLATIANVIEKTNPVLEFLLTKAGIAFHGPNHDGSNKNIERRLNIRGLEVDNLEVVWAKKNVEPATQLPKLQELLREILQQEGGWLENWLAVPELAELTGQPTIVDPPPPEVSAEDRKIDEKIRSSIVENCKWIRLAGIRQPADVTRLPLKTSFVSLQFKDHKDEEKAENLLGDLKSRKGSGLASGAAPQNLNIEQVLNEAHRCIVTGPPGNGKTTLTQMVALKVAEGLFAGKISGIHANTIPLLIKVRTLDGRFNRLPNITEIVRINVPDIMEHVVTEDYARRLFEGGRVMLILDGLDECELPDAGAAQELNPNNSVEWARLIKWITDICVISDSIRLVATSRNVTTSFSPLIQLGFKQFQILPLSTEHQQPQFIDNWYAALCSLPKEKNELLDHTGKPGDKESLISILKSSKNKLEHWCQTPLYLSAICAMHYDGKLDFSKPSKFPEQFIEFQLAGWRSEHQQQDRIPKKIQITLETSQLRQMLSELALAMVRKNARTADTNLVLDIFKSTLDKMGIKTVTAVQILKGIIDRSDILVKDAPGQFSFYHDQFRELLAGHELAKLHALDELTENSGKDNWKEVIKFSAEKLSGSQKTLVQNLANNGAQVFAAQVASHIGLNQESIINYILQRTVEVRGKITVLTEFKTAEAVAKLFALRSLFLAAANEKKFVAAALVPNEKQELFDLTRLARRNAHRCCHSKTLDFLDFRDGIRAITYVRDTFADQDDNTDKALSWLSVSFGIYEEDAPDKEADEFHKKANNDDPVYNFAVMLDTVTTDQNLLISGFEIYQQSEGLELLGSNLLPLVLFEYKIDQGVELAFDKMLEVIKRIPQDMSPATQIGVLNSMVLKRGAKISAVQLSEATRLWRRCVDAIEDSLTRLVGAWHKDLGIMKNGKLVSASKEYLMEHFKTEFRKELSKHKPFSFEVDADGKHQPE